jgi:hypothetical protein
MSQASPHKLARLIDPKANKRMIYSGIEYKGEPLDHLLESSITLCQIDHGNATTPAIFAVRFELTSQSPAALVPILNVFESIVLPLLLLTSGFVKMTVHWRKTLSVVVKLMTSI